jgi:hypothetical protein
VTTQEIRAHLCKILCRIEQISSQSINALCTRPAALAASTRYLGVRASLVLVCISVFVTSTPCESTLGTLLAQLDEQGIVQMASELQESPLFRFQIGPCQLRDTLWSLELIFSGDDDENLDCSPGIGDPFYEQLWTVHVQHEIRTWQCHSSPKGLASSIQNDTTGQKPRRPTMSTPDRLRSRSVSRRQKLLSSDESVNDSSTTLTV